MKIKNLLLAVVLCIMQAPVIYSTEPWTIRIRIDDADNNSEGKTAPSCIIERGRLTSVCRYKNHHLENEPSDDLPECQTIRTTLPGQIGEKLGENIHTVDSLVIYGLVDESDFYTMWSASFHGNLKVINLENADIVNCRIPDRAFWHQDEQLEPGGEYIDCIYLKRIILPENITEIGENAFSYAINLENINIPKSLLKINEAAFSDCVSLNVNPLVFPEGMEEICGFTFLNCKELTGDVILPSTIQHIGDGAFFQAKISSINLPEGLISIGEAAFYACRLKDVRLPESCWDLHSVCLFQLNLELESIHLPEGMECIPYSFANACLKLREINIPSSVKTIDDYALWQCRSIKEVQLPDKLESIGTVGLWYLDSLEQIRFPSTLKYLGGESCEYWANINQIYCEATDPPVCADSRTNPGSAPFGSYGSTFYMHTPPDTPVYVPIGTSDKYRKAWGWDYFTNFIETDFSGIESVFYEKHDK